MNASPNLTSSSITRMHHAQTAFFLLPPDNYRRLPPTHAPRLFINRRSTHQSRLVCRKSAPNASSLDQLNRQIIYGMTFLDPSSSVRFHHIHQPHNLGWAISVSSYALRYPETNASTNQPSNPRMIYNLFLTRVLIVYEFGSCIPFPPPLFGY
ncbi:hypothetical protein B0F90DRAFT_927746 [Multifurca ochricompacta]|uniref:Uncharacterized protein n=1 Tax=Multifurca ochricompacta TaxID=376703 RepID=A0AAD4M9K9_9AGAM|nr:hypothetical protein B0F90DRAFT_927746 [Multifurca ochricompacta]